MGEPLGRFLAKHFVDVSTARKEEREAAKYAPWDMAVEEAASLKTHCKKAALADNCSCCLTMVAGLRQAP